jgi:hypothetical protein
MFPIKASQFNQLFTTDQIFIYLGISLVVSLLLFYSSMKFLLVLQQCGYRGSRYFKWLSNKNTPYLSRLMLLCLLGFLFFLVLNTCFAPVVGETIASYVGFVSFVLFTALYIKSESSVNAKVPLKKTGRIIRLCITYVIVINCLNLFR